MWGLILPDLLGVLAAQTTAFQDHIVSIKQGMQKTLLDCLVVYHEFITEIWHYPFNETPFDACTCCLRCRFIMLILYLKVLLPYSGFHCLCMRCVVCTCTPVCMCMYMCVACTRSMRVLHICIYAMWRVHVCVAQCISVCLCVWCVRSECVDCGFMYVCTCMCCIYMHLYARMLAGMCVHIYMYMYCMSVTTMCALSA